jgi:hypothetical protein
MKIIKCITFTLICLVSFSTVYAQSVKDISAPMVKENKQVELLLDEALAKIDMDYPRFMSAHAKNDPDTPRIAAVKSKNFFFEISIHGIYCTISGDVNNFPLIDEYYFSKWVGDKRVFLRNNNLRYFYYKTYLVFVTGDDHSELFKKTTRSKTFSFTQIEHSLFSIRNLLLYSNVYDYSNSVFSEPPLVGNR